MDRVNKLDQETIKTLNQKKILHLLYKNKELTKQDIAKELGVSIPTAITNVNELKEEGYLEEAGVGESTGGRKPIIIRFLPNARYSFGVCVTGDYVRVVLTNLNFEIIDELCFEIPEHIQDVDNTMLRVKSLIDQIINKNGIDRKKILGVGFALPGTVDEEELLLENAPNLAIRKVNFTKYKELLGFPVFIENEANAAANAESFINFQNEMKSLIFVSITEGIGTGIMIGENLYKGYNKRAGEFGHMTIVKDGKKCSCGKKGCWEAYASEKALLKEYNRLFKVNDRNLKSFLELTKKDDNAKKLLERYLDYLSEGLKNIILMLDPENIVIGGEIAYYEDIIKEPLEKFVFEENNFYTKNECHLLFSNLKGNASILGATLLPIKTLF